MFFRQRRFLSSFSKIQAILSGWLLLLSFWIPRANLERLLPDLWKPIFPFQWITYSDALMSYAVWGWRIALVACVFLPRNPFALGLGFLFSFFCLGIQNCFGLEMQLFASLELAFLFLFLFSLLSLRYGNMEKELAFSIKLVCVLLFFSAGLSKLKWSGPGWGTSESLQQYFQMLHQINRDVFGFDWVLSLRARFLENTALVKAGAILTHAFELFVPAALFSRRASRLFLLGSVAFIVSVWILLGVRFFPVLPLLLIWGIWDVKAQEIFPTARHALALTSLAFPAFVALQLVVTLYVGKNSWPLMANDMYARPIALTPFIDSGASVTSPLRDFTIEVVRRDGRRESLARDANFAPFSRFHIFIALLKTREAAARNALLEKVFVNYREHNCREACEEAVGMVATKRFDSSAQVLAGTSSVIAP